MKRHDWTVLALIGASGLSGLALTSRFFHRSEGPQRIEVIRIEIESPAEESPEEAPWVATWVPLRRWESERGLEVSWIPFKRMTPRTLGVSPQGWRPVSWSTEYALQLKGSETPIRYSGPGGRELGLDPGPSLWKRPKLGFRPPG